MKPESVSSVRNKKGILMIYFGTENSGWNGTVFVYSIS